MKAKRIMAFLMALTLTLTLSACGNINTAQEIMANNVETKESEKIKSEETEEEEEETETTEAEDDEAVDEVDKNEAVDEVDEDKAVDETDESEETEPAETVEPVETAEPKTDKTDTAKPEPTATPEPTTAPTPEPSAPVQTEKPVTTPAPTTAPTPAPTVAPTPEPVHQHSWKEHVATTQVWVPNIVVVDDYEEQKVIDEYTLICNCGYTTSGDNAVYDMVAHSKANLTYEHSYYTVHERTHTEQVKVGSHEEDHGYYETSSYVDYYYCDCGERK